MLAKRLIPCLDIRDGRVVKGVQFEQIRDAGDPVECASRYSDGGADEICFLDITASHEGRGTFVDVVERTAERTAVPLTVGGGVRTLEDVRTLLNAGADKVSINTAAIVRPELIQEVSEQYGRQVLVVAVDARRRVPVEGELLAQQLRWDVCTHGGRRPSGLEAVQWCTRVAELGAGEILLTSMDRDGTGIGCDLELTRKVAQSVGIPVIASGGVGDLDHLVDALTRGAASAALAATIFHDHIHTLGEAKAYLQEKGVIVRPVTPGTPDGLPDPSVPPTVASATS